MEGYNIYMVGLTEKQSHQIGSQLQMILEYVGGDVDKLLQCLNRERNLMQNIKYNNGKRLTSYVRYRDWIKSYIEEDKDYSWVLKRAKEVLSRTSFWRLKKELGVHN